MDLDKVRINSGKLYKNGNFNAEESMYWSNIYVGDAVREVTEQLKNINTNLEKIANKDIISTTVNNLTPTYKGEYVKPLRGDIMIGPGLNNYGRDDDKY